MRLDIHFSIAKKICAEIKGLGFHLNAKSFLFGNLFPDLIHSYIWRRHEYHNSRDYIRKKIESFKKRPFFFSFQLGIVTHYICDYFCYPHSSAYDKGLLQHILYEYRQKVPKNPCNLNIDIPSFSIEELDKFVGWYERFRRLLSDDDHDFQMAALVSSCFLQAALRLSFNEGFASHPEKEPLYGDERYPAYAPACVRGGLAA